MVTLLSPARSSGDAGEDQTAGEQEDIEIHTNLHTETCVSCL